MVRFRGIEVSIISQFDIHSLPEYQCHQSDSPSTSSGKNAIVCCYIPIYPGSQIWFEYRIDGPHPPEASYFFKVLFNERVITSFGCGPDDNYHGKMMYNLVAQGRDALGGIPIVRQALFFRSEIEDAPPGKKDDVMEVRIHRVERRKRIRQLQDDPGILISTKSSPHDTLQLAEGGPLDPGFPRRRYKFQLVDAVDEPYATFRFFCRSHDYLRRHGIIGPLKGSYSQLGSVSEPDQEESIMADSAPRDGETDEERSVLSGPYIPPSESDGNLSILTRDSLEDLLSTVSRHPRSHTKDSANSFTIDAPARSSSIRKLKTRLTLNLNGTDFDLERKSRPLKPKGSMLRKLVPPSAPAAVTEFGPTIEEELEKSFESTNASQASSLREEMLVARTTRAERGGKSLMGFLSRRAAK